MKINPLPKNVSKKVIMNDDITSVLKPETPPKLIKKHKYKLSYPTVRSSLNQTKNRESL